MSSLSSSAIKKAFLSIALSILYGAISISLDPRYADFITEQDFGDIRPAIFFPAIIAILYGPVVGAITASVGNLLYDTVTNLYLDPVEPLAIDNAVGFVGNFIGAFIVGIFANPYRNASELFEMTHEETKKFRKYFNLAFIRRLFRNTLASVIGMGFVTGLIIGYGLRLEPGFDPEVSFIVFTAIAYWNGFFLLSAIPIIYFTISLMDYFQERREDKLLEARRTIQIHTPNEYPFRFVSAKSPIGDELWNFQWGAIEFVIKNSDDIPHKYAIRIASNDIFSPHRHTTPVLQPGEEDELYFNVYGISAGNKESTIYVKVGDEIKERKMQFKYEMGSTNKLLFNKIMGIMLIIAFGMSAVLIILNIRDNLVLDNATLFALAITPLEIVFVLALYIIWNNKATNKFLQTMGLRKEAKEEFQLMSEVVEEEKAGKQIKKIERKRLMSTIFLLLALVTFLAVSFIVVLEENGTDIYSNDFVIIIIGVLLVLFLISDLYLGQARQIEQNILEQKELISKVIRNASTDSTPEIFSPTKIYLRIFNPFDTKGMRIFFHSIDNITPRELNLDDIEPQGMETIEVYYTPLQEGKRNIGVEVVQLTDDQNNIIPQEIARTFDQEMIKLKVSSARVLGLDQNQIGILRGMIAGIGSISIAVTFISGFFDFSVNEQFLQTTLPLLIILQSPVIWLTLALKERIQKTFEAGK